jgi:hypothetical protein
VPSAQVRSHSTVFSAVSVEADLSRHCLCDLEPILAAMFFHTFAPNVCTSRASNSSSCWVQPFLTLKGSWRGAGGTAVSV